MTTQPTAYNIKYKFSKNMKILFIGINPHPGSDKREVPFSNNKTFWYLLSDSEIIKESRKDLKNNEDLKKLYNAKFSSKYNLGFVNLIDRPTRDVTQLKKNEERLGVERVLQIIKKFKPKIVAFIGKVTYEKFSRIKKVDYGWKSNIYGSRVYVLHFPIRGRASIRINELKKLKI